MRRVRYRLAVGALVFCRLSGYLGGVCFMIPHWLPALAFAVGLSNVYSGRDQPRIQAAEILSIAEVALSFAYYLLLPVLASAAELFPVAWYVLFTAHQVLQMLLFYALFSGMEAGFRRYAGAAAPLARACRLGGAVIPVGIAFQVLLCGAMMIGVHPHRSDYMWAALGGADLLLLAGEIYLLTRYGKFNAILERDAAVEPERLAGRTEPPAR